MRLKVLLFLARSFPVEGRGKETVGFTCDGMDIEAPSSSLAKRVLAGLTLMGRDSLAQSQLQLEVRRCTKPVCSPCVAEEEYGALFSTTIAWGTILCPVFGGTPRLGSA